MKTYQDGVGGLERVLTEAPLRHHLQPIGGHPFIHTVRHRGEPQIRPVRDQGGKQGRKEIGHPRGPLIRTVEGLGKVTPRAEPAKFEVE